MAAEEMIQWGGEYLSSHGYTLKSNVPESVQITPWSYVVRFATTDGYIYLKHTPNLLALEAAITQILYDQFHAAVPEIIDHNPELNCFLMKDAGRPLREVLKNKFDAVLLCKAINQFTSIQLVVADHINVFLELGVPDWRLDKLPGLYQQLLSQKELLIADGLSEIEISELKALLPQVSHLCKKLSDYSIKQTIVQCDFHDNNLLVNEISQKITIIDLGEIVISHPFFSLVGCLRQAKTHHGLRDQDEVYAQLMDACLKNYLTSESNENLLDAFAIASILWLAYEALAQYRLRLACDESKFLLFQRQGKLSDRLKEFMSACSSIDTGLSLNTTFIKNIQEIYGETGQVWLQNLDSHLAKLSSKHNFKFINPVSNLSYNFVGLVENIKTSEIAIIKMAPNGIYLAAEAKWLKCFNTAVPKIDWYDDENHAFLMERLVPGHSLKKLVREGQDDAATRIICQVIKNLQAHQVNTNGFKHISELAKSLPKLKGKIDGYLLSKAISLFNDLSADRTHDVILHGDLHHDNILASGQMWKAIDPHGYRGDPVFEIGAMILNPFDCFPTSISISDTIERRLKILAEELSFDPQRIKSWAFCRTMLSVAWTYEDHAKVDVGELEIAAMIQKTKL